MATITRDAAIGTLSESQQGAIGLGGQMAAFWRSAKASIIALAIGILLWEIAGRVLQFSFLPPFSAAISATWRMTLSGEIPRNIIASLTALVIGYLLAVAVGVPLGLLMGRYRKLDYALDPFLSILLASPSILFVPILFSIFGTSRLTQVFLVFLYVLIIVTINSRAGIKMVDTNHVEMARSFGADERQVLTRILLPGSLPMVMSGLRLGMGRGVRAMINGEMLIVLVGLGALLRQYGSRFDAASVYGLLLVVIAVALVCTSLVQWLERRVTRWAD
jgi:NitT/TauT family transport system permease protein